MNHWWRYIGPYWHIFTTIFIVIIGVSFWVYSMNTAMARGKSDHKIVAHSQRQIDRIDNNIFLIGKKLRVDLLPPIKPDNDSDNDSEGED